MGLAKTPSAPRILGYRRALEWLLVNDDTTWLDDEHPSPSITLCLVADIYGKDTDQATADLKWTKERMNR